MIKKMFALECTMNDQQESHQRDMDWLKEMFLYEAERREFADKQLSLVSDLLVVEQQRCGGLEARCQLLEAEKQEGLKSLKEKRGKWRRNKGREG